VIAGAAARRRGAHSQQGGKRLDALRSSLAGRAQVLGPSTYDAPEETKRAMLGTFVVVQSAVLRGAMTAIGWLSEGARAIETFKTVEEAIAEAKRRLGGAGITVAPPVPYRLPVSGE